MVLLHRAHSTVCLEHMHMRASTLYIPANNVHVLLTIHGHHKWRGRYFEIYRGHRCDILESSHGY